MTTKTIPQWLQQRREACDLDPTHGLGAIKWLLDEFRVNIVRHEYVGVNFVSLRRGRGPTRRFKVHTAGRVSGYVAPFGVRNFMREDAPEQYLFVAFEPQPMMWTATADELSEVYDYPTANRVLPPGEGGARINYDVSEYTQGALHLALKATHPWRVKSHKDLRL